MNGTGRDSQNSGVWRYRQVGRRAVRLEVREAMADTFTEGYRIGFETTGFRRLNNA